MPKIEKDRTASKRLSDIAHPSAPHPSAVATEELLTPEQQLAQDAAMASMTSGGTGVGSAAPQAAPGTGTVAGPEGSLSLWADVWRRMRKNRLAVVGLGIIGLFVLTAALAPLIAPYPAQGPPAQRIEVAAHCGGPCPPSLNHWFGTDQLGQDIFSRVVYGTRVSVLIGVGAVAIALVVGLTLGAIAGYYGKGWDAFIMRLADVFFAFPFILAAIVLIIVLGQGVRNMVIAIGIFGWATIARLLRSSVLSTREHEYVEAARALGGRNGRIITRHILPNSLAPVIVFATIFTGTAILTEAALSFLGLGVGVGVPAWGQMVAGGKQFLQTRPYMIVFPGLAIITTVLGFIFVGDGLRDSMDPRLR